MQTENVARAFLHESRGTRSLLLFFLPSPLPFFQTPWPMRIVVGNSAIQGTLPLPGSSAFPPSSLFFPNFFFPSPCPPFRRKKTRAASFHAPHGTLSFIFFSLFFFAPTVRHPASPYFPPLDSDPFVRSPGPAQRPATFELFFSTSPLSLSSSRRFTYAPISKGGGRW